ncbi:YggS family pyridoxal phosphate-dependent enzyme [Actimicrobium antarcticum]|uniref:Pyridoxal phosphate homeostasis protein n=1 Tax=Actimicrobium antarcticum TaxID=1051899 RepID=A0ABP7SLV5_9BURK
MSLISRNLQAVHGAIDAAAQAVSRQPHAVSLLAVSKTFAVSAVLEAAAAGQRAFGENYLQEALDKIAVVRATRPDLALEWHFIGPIQSNKTRPIAESFDWVHSVEREKIARRLSDQRPEKLPPLNICLQVNISGEASKSGVPASEALAVAHAIAAMPRLRLRGLMAIPEPTSVVAEQRLAFRQLHDLFDQCRAAGLDLDTLSMGMSSDLPAAIAEGATIVRVGTAIFGTRTYAE